MKEPRDYTAEDFAAEPDINKRRKMFLDSTVAFYNSTNRALGDSGCVYQPTAYSHGCAIGRFVPSLHYKEGCILDNANYSLLPPWMIDMGSSFIYNIQLLHDSGANWDVHGLSEEGKQDLKYFNIFL
jgi:hypothetical protein